MDNKEYIYFGILFNEEKTPKYMTKDNFVNRNLDQNKYLTNFAKEEALKNYDLNIKYFNNLNQEEFDRTLEKLLNLYAF